MHTCDFHVIFAMKIVQHYVVMNFIIIPNCTIVYFQKVQVCIFIQYINFFLFLQYIHCFIFLLEYIYHQSFFFYNIFIDLFCKNIFIWSFLQEYICLFLFDIFLFSFTRCLKLLIRHILFYIFYPTNTKLFLYNTL